MAKASKITPRAQNFPQWYQDTLAIAPDLFDESPVTGCITFGPLATKLWANIRSFFDARLQAFGVENIMLPMLIPQSMFAREKEHVEGFSPEVAVVTHAGGAQLPEPYYIRPTSELLFVDWFSRSGRVASYRHLPLLVNQWCSVMRWEKRPRAFLRTAEFHWQEGHCLFPSESSCREFTLKILDLYAELAEEILAIPVVKGTKPSHEMFPGALATYTIEAMMQDGKALQMGTSHVLSQKFLQRSDGEPIVSYLDEKEQRTVPFYDSWGISTRLLGAIFMAHGDDDGIVLPPRIAPVQIAVLPIFGPEESENARVKEAALTLASRLAESSPFNPNWKGSIQSYPLHGREKWFQEVSGALTVRVDLREDARIGDKTFYQIHAGTPVRIEIGPRDLAAGTCIVKSRIRSREEAIVCPLEKAPEVVRQILLEDQNKLFTRSKERMTSRIVQPKNPGELTKALAEGFWASSPWDGQVSTVTKLKEATSGGTYRCFPFDAAKDSKGKNDAFSGAASAFDQSIIIAKAY